MAPSAPDDDEPAEPAPASAKPQDDTPVDIGPFEDVDVLVTKDIRDDVEQALELADYIVRHGTKRNDSSLPTWILRTIKFTVGRIGPSEQQQAELNARASAKDIVPTYIKASEWTRFEQAYYALAEFSSPVTIDTLRDTRATGKNEGSPAQAFTHRLWYITIFIIIGVLTGGVIATGAEGANVYPSWRSWCRFFNDYVPILVPWMYGGLGACAYLLRTAHDMLAKRCFDVRRQPEYYNRILLGAVSGGSIVLLVSPSGDDDEVVKVSAAALGFLAGYSNDLLFNAVERVTSALLPKTELETAQKDRSVAKPIDLQAGGLTMKDLLERMEAATRPEDKEFYRSLLEKLRDRM